MLFLWYIIAIIENYIQVPTTISKSSMVSCRLFELQVVAAAFLRAMKCLTCRWRSRWDTGWKKPCQWRKKQKSTSTVLTSCFYPRLWWYRICSHSKVFCNLQIRKGSRAAVAIFVKAMHMQASSPKSEGIPIGTRWFVTRVWPRNF